MFLHGGGFSEGDRAHYGYIAEPFAEHGVVTAVASYRLSSYPKPVEDTKAIITSLYKNVARYGGDPQAIYVSGHSAGAIMAGDVGADRSWMTAAGVPKSALKGIVPVSGRYELVPGSGLENCAAGTEQRKLASPVLHVKDPAPGVVTAYGYGSTHEMENEMKAPSLAFGDRMRGAGASVTVVELPGQDHIRTALSLADPNSPLFKAVLTLMQIP